MDNKTLIYLAGALDSDGCISIRKLIYPKRATPKYQGFVYQISTVSTIPNLMAETFGGRVNRYAHYNKRPNEKPIYRYETCSPKAVVIVKYLLPYLRVKREQALCIIQLQELIDEFDGRHHGRVPDKEVARREALYLEIKQLNQ